MQYEKTLLFLILKPFLTDESLHPFYRKALI